MKKYLTIFLSLAMLLVARDTHAVINADAALNANSQVKVQTGASNSAKADISASADLEVDADFNDDSSNSGDKSSTSTPENDGVGTTTASIGGQIRILARDLRGWDTEEKAEFLTTLKSAIEVKTDKDLENFAQGVLLKDENVSSVSVDNEDVKVAYKQKAKFLGFIPATLDAEVTASSESDVKVRMPWYRFMFKVENEVNAETLQQTVAQSMNANLSANASVMTKAKIIDAVVAGLEAQGNGELEVD